MKKSFLPYIIFMILAFVFNLIVEVNSFRLNPIDFLSDYNSLFPVFMLLTVVVYYVYYLINYFVWCKRSEKSIANGGVCSKNGGGVHRAVEIIFMVISFGCLGCYLYQLAFPINWLGLLLTIAQMPILMIVFWSSIKYLKKKKATASKNKIISYTVLIIADFAYLVVL